MSNGVKKIFAIAYITLTEALRNKALSVLLIFAIILIASANFFGFFSPGEEIKIVKDIGLSAIMVFGMLIVLFGASNLIPGETEKGTIAAILSKPVRRFEFAMGKFLGLLGILVLNLVIMSSAFCIVLYMKHSSVGLPLIKAFILIFFELTLLASFVLCVSTRASTLFNGIFGLFIFVIGHLSNNLEHMAEMTQSVLLKIFLNLAYDIIPNFENFNIRNAIVVNNPVTGIYVSKVIIYGVLYTAIMLTLTYLLIRNKEV